MKKLCAFVVVLVAAVILEGCAAVREHLGGAKVCIEGPGGIGRLCLEVGEPEPAPVPAPSPEDPKEETASPPASPAGGENEDLDEDLALAGGPSR